MSSLKKYRKLKTWNDGMSDSPSFFSENHYSASWAAESGLHCKYWEAWSCFVRLQHRSPNGKWPWWISITSHSMPNSLNPQQLVERSTHLHPRCCTRTWSMEPSFRICSPAPLKLIADHQSAPKQRQPPLTTLWPRGRIDRRHLSGGSHPPIHEIWTN